MKRIVESGRRVVGVEGLESRRRSAEVLLCVLEDFNVNPEVS